MQTISQAYANEPVSGGALTHLQRLEAESINIIREAAAGAENPVMLYSIGKDSSAMLHLAMNAFYRVAAAKAAIRWARVSPAR